MAIQFRKATNFDAPAIAEIFQPEVPKGHFRGFGHNAAVKVFNSMVAHESITIDSALGQIEMPVSSWVAVEDNQVVGFFITKPWLDYQQTREKINSGVYSATTSDVELWILAVRADSRGKGIGRACLERQISDAKRLARGTGKIYARCYPVSTRAIELLKQNGFHEHRVDSDGVVLQLK